MNNPYQPQSFAGTPVVNSMQHEQQQGLDFLNRFKAGQVGPQGFNADQIAQIIQTFSPHAFSDPQIAAALEPFVQVGEGTNAPLNLRYASLGYRAAQGANGGQINPEVAAFLNQNATTTPGLQEQGALFNYLAPTFANNPDFQHSFGGFVGRVAPGGQVPLNEAAIGAVAPTYNYLRQYAPDVASQFGVQLPTDATNLSNPLRDAIRSAAQGALKGEGFNYVTPGGPSRFTPLQNFGNLIKEGAGVLGQGYTTAADALTGGAFGAPAASAPSSVSSNGQAGKAALAGVPVRGARPSNSSPTTPQNAQQGNLAATQAYLQQNGIPLGTLEQALASNQYGPQFARLLGNQGVNQLLAWAQRNLPQGAQLPSGTIDPFRALFNSTQ